MIVLYLRVVSALCLFALSVGPASAATVQSNVREWFFAKTVARCFPGVVSTGFFRSGNGDPAFSPALPLNPIKRPGAELASQVRNEMTGTVIAQSGHDLQWGKDVEAFFGAYDPAASAVALQHVGYEYDELVLVGDVMKAPARLRRKTLRVALSNGFTLGTPRSAVERFFGYSGRAAAVRRCGMLGERFAMPHPGAVVSFSFIFAKDRVVALGYAFAM
ncbi:MAG: hypothetical protein JWM87_3545 [Candidatus Eremiobacteraeota bacterium]|nr:hypothetical protein [Candidatus Eremiobacteraeota bacterium]